jgi:hypothetical protein
LVDALLVSARVDCGRHTFYHGLWRVAGAVFSMKFYITVTVVFDGNYVPVRPAEQIEANMLLRCFGDITTHVIIKFVSYVTAYYHQDEQV